MVAIQIRDVPDELRDALARDAQARGQSLQAYLLALLQRQADAAHNAEFLRTWQPPQIDYAWNDDNIVIDLIEQQRRERDERTLGGVPPKTS
ncbi:MAG: hypothetical protein GX542_01230 [Rhodococcus sp.]|nr:hypothetical protein [Rhodococcus sp. (in: high G+C Gram-positive bacteria)]